MPADEDKNQRVARCLQLQWKPLVSLCRWLGEGDECSHDQDDFCREGLAGRGTCTRLHAVCTEQASALADVEPRRGFLSGFFDCHPSLAASV